MSADHLMNDVSVICYHVCVGLTVATQASSFIW
jgi:hypothetical protein